VTCDRSSRLLQLLNSLLRKLLQIASW
jgi:hypothetical protein